MPRFMPRGYGRKRYYPRRKSWVRFPARRTTINTQEKKFKDLEVSGAAGVQFNFATTWGAMYFDSDSAQFSPLATIAQGTGDNQRIGRSIWLHEIYLKLCLDSPYTNNATLGTQAFRICLVLDMEPCAANPTSSIIFAETDNNNTMRNLYYSRRFKILKDIKSTFRPTALWDSGVNQPDLTGHKKLVDASYKFKTPLRVEYGGTAGTVADLTDKNIQVWVIQQEGVPQINVAKNDSFVRMRFTDNPGLRGPIRYAPLRMQVLGKRPRTLFPAPDPGLGYISMNKRLRGGSYW